MEMLAKNKPPVRRTIRQKSIARRLASRIAHCKWPEFPADKLKTAPTVPLLQATQLYQPVKGSSSHSRYFLVGANSELRIAARYKQQSLSIRVEGQAFAKNKARLEACGFTGVNKRLRVDAPGGGHPGAGRQDDGRDPAGPGDEDGHARARHPAAAQQGSLTC